MSNLMNTIAVFPLLINQLNQSTTGGELCESGRVYVDPSAFVVAEGVKYSRDKPFKYVLPIDTGLS